MFRIELDPDSLGSGLFEDFSLKRLGARFADFSLSAAKGILALPAGIERLILDPIIPGEFDPVRDLMDATDYLQETVRLSADLDESSLTNFLGEMAGAIAIGAPILKTSKFLVGRLPGAFSAINPESARLAGVAIGAEGGLFVAGFDRESSATSILVGTAFGAGAGAGVTKLTQRFAAKRAAAVVDDVPPLAVIGDDLDPLEPRTIGGVKFDINKGAGSVGDQRNIAHTGLEVSITPNEFLSLAAERTSISAPARKAITEAIEGERGIAPGFLDIDFSSGAAKVRSHEGRSRMMILVEKGLGDTPVPVSIFGRGGMRAADFGETELQLLQRTLAQKGAVNESTVLDITARQVVKENKVIRSGLAEVTEETAEAAAKSTAETLSNLNKTAAIPDDTLAISNETITGIRLALSEAGEGGAMGAVKSVVASVDELARLRAEFPAYRIEQVGDRVIYGLKPGTRLPKGTTRTAPSLTDKVLKEYEAIGYLRDEKVLLDGVTEVSIKGTGPAGKIRIKAGAGRKPEFVDADRVSPLAGEVGGKLVNPRLLEEFKIFRFGNARQIDDVDDAIRRFVAQLDDVDPVHKPALTEYLADEIAKDSAERLRPDARGWLKRFHATKSQVEKTGKVTSLEEAAAAKDLWPVSKGGGRVQIVDTQTGRSGPEMFFKNKAAAKAFVDAFERNAIDMTPGTGVPQTLLKGAAYEGTQLAPGVDATEEIINKGIEDGIKRGGGALTNFLYRTAGRWFRGIEASALDIERRGYGKIWTEAIQPLSFKMAVANNRSNARARQFNKIFKRMSAEEQDLMDGWLRSELKETFEQTQGMSAKLIKQSEQVRKLLNETFDELAVQSGTTLSLDDYFRNFVPDMTDLVAQQGHRDLLAARRAVGQDIPQSLTFWNEMFKSGELGTQQAALGVKINRMLRAGYRKAYAGEEFEHARRFINTLDNDDSKRVLADYLTGIMGNWDASRDALKAAVTGFYKDLGLNVPPGQINTIVDDLVGASYSALMGFRVQLALRNHTQMFNLLAPVIGFRRTANAFAKASKFENAQWARAIGAVRDQLPVTHADALADKNIGLRGLLRRLERGSLRLYTHADEHNRAVAAVAMRDVVQTYLPKLKAGELTQRQFLNKTGISVFDDSIINRFFDILERGGVRETNALALIDPAEDSIKELVGVIGDTFEERATNYIAREMSNLTNFLYGASNAPAWVRTAPGKIFGSYSTFSFGYANYLQTMLRNGSTSEKVARLSKHALVNYAIFTAGTNIGIDLSRWVAGSSINYIGGTGWAGGPQTDLAIDVTKMLGGAPWEREKHAKHFASSIPRLLIPGAAFGRDLWLATEYLKDDRPEAAAARALGFSIADAVDSEPGALGPARAVLDDAGISLDSTPTLD